MTLSTADEQNLLTALHDGLYEQPLWASFLDRLRTRVQADYAGILLCPPCLHGDMITEFCTGEPSPLALRGFYRGALNQQPGFPAFNLRPERIYSIAELLELSNPAHANIYNELFVSNGFRHMRIARIVEPGGTSAWLSIARDKSDFTGADAALLRNLVPHAQRALRAYVTIEQERFRSGIAAEMMQRLNFGWISLDAASRIIETSPHADHLLQHCGELRRDRHGRLVAARQALDYELSDAIKRCATNPHERPRALSISRDPWIEILVVPARGAQNTPPAHQVAIAYVQGDNQTASNRHEQIADLFGLLPSEARLALVLSQGMSIAEGADALGLTVETARNYSKKIYAKMGARGQADLIRFILASVLALA